MKRLSALTVLLASLVLVVASATRAKNVASPPSASGRQELESDPDRFPRDGIEIGFDYQDFLQREKNGEIRSQKGPVPSRRAPGTATPSNVLINNNAGATTSGQFTQSETTVVAFGNTVVAGFNDSGSFAGGANKFTGFSYSTDGGVTWTDGGTLPTNPNGDAGDPVMARDAATGRIYFSTLQFSNSGIDVFHSDDNGVTWSAPVQGAPGKTDLQDKEWIAVDNFAGSGQGNLYLIERDFGSGDGVYFFRSTDGGSTFGPSGGTLIVSSMQGGFVAVGPDHAVHAFWLDGATLKVRKSTDRGLTFAAPVTVASGLVGSPGLGDLGLTGLRQGTPFAESFRSNEFPHAAVNPVNGNIYVTYDNKGAGADIADVFLVQSTDGGATWSAPIKVNDDSTTTDQWQPTLAVSTDGSRLGVFYYSRQEDPANNNLFKYYGRIAVVSGSTLTFIPSFAVSDTASLPEFGHDDVVNPFYMGDYNTAFATPGAFHVTWSDNRDDLPGGAPRKDPNSYYSRIPIGMAVASTVPAVGSIVSSQPTSFTVNVTDPVNPATLDAADFQVNGIGASSVSYTAGTTTITFGFVSTPVTSQGLQTMHVDAGAFLRASDSAPVLQFDGTFRYDAVLLQVTSTNPPFPNGVFTLPAPFTFDVNFNEPIDPASVQAADLALSGIGGAFVSGVTVLPGNTTARFTLDGITAEGTLTAQIAAGAITDQFGNSGAAFFQSYQVDIGTAAFSTALGSPPPLGNLIYGTGAEGLINFAGDTDAFTLQVDAGQTLSVVVYPLSAGLQPTATIFNPANGVIASATAAAAGQKAVIQTVPAATAGTYRTVVGGAGGTTGDYLVQLILNEAIESEILLPVSNDTPATAQNIDGSFLTLQTSVASAQRGAVSGIADSSTPDHYSFTLAAGDVVTLALKGVSFPLSNALDLLDPGASVVASGVGGADLDEVINNFVVPPGGGGTYYARVGSGGEDGYALVVTRNAAFDTESNDSFATAQPLGGNRGALGAIQEDNPEDWYSLVVPPGQQSVRIETSTPGDGPGQFVNVLDPHIELYNPSNTLIASGTVLADGRNESISIVVPTSGTYRIRVTGEGNTIGEYFLGAKAFASVTSLSPAKVWIGLFNSDDVGIRFDLQATVLKSGTPIGSGVLTSVFAGSSGFNNAVLDSIPLTLTAPVQMVSGDSLQIKLEARNACSGSSKNSGRARLWYNGQPIDSGATRDAGSRFDATIGGSNTNYYLRTGSALSTTAGSAKTTQDVLVGAKCGPFVSFGTWSITLP